MIFSCLIVFDVFEAFMDLSVRAYAINVDLNIASKKKSQEKRRNHVGFVMKR